MVEILRHFFLPRESNNHRAKVLHHKSLLILIILFFAGQFFIVNVKTNFPQVLGTTTDIKLQELLLLTNTKRQAAGLPTLVMDDQLSLAASLKAKYMLEKNYWAHNAPDGTTPWFFFKKVNYDYVYAGENLARGFSSSSDIVNAWMASQTHKDNVLSKNYQEVGFAVLDGKLLGEDTTLVVEMFGSKAASSLARNIKENLPANPLNHQEERVVFSSGTEQVQAFTSEKRASFINSKTLSWNIAMFTVLLFISILCLDMIIINRRKIVRLVGHNIDHILFFAVILILIVMFGKGVIL